MLLTQEVYFIPGRKASHLPVGRRKKDIERSLPFFCIADGNSDIWVWTFPCFQQGSLSWCLAFIQVIVCIGMLSFLSFILTGIFAAQIIPPFQQKAWLVHSAEYCIIFLSSSICSQHGTCAAVFPPFKGYNFYLGSDSSDEASHLLHRYLERFSLLKPFLPQIVQSHPAHWKSLWNFILLGVGFQVTQKYKTFV